MTLRVPLGFHTEIHCSLGESFATDAVMFEIVCTVAFAVERHNVFSQEHAVD